MAADTPIGIVEFTDHARSNIVLVKPLLYGTAQQRTFCRKQRWGLVQGLRKSGAELAR